MTNNCRTECADCEHSETCLLEDYQCSMLEESEDNEFVSFILNSYPGFKITDNLPNCGFIATSEYGVVLSRIVEEGKANYKVELNFDLCDFETNQNYIENALQVGFSLIEDIANFEKNTLKTN